MRPLKILVTGASGFIGRAFCDYAASLPGIAVTACSRRPLEFPHPSISPLTVLDYHDSDAMRDALSDSDCVVHAAGRAHVLRKESADALAEYRRGNVNTTRRIACLAAAAGVCRFVFLSSVGVHGEVSVRPFTEEDLPSPSRPYSVAKYEAEQVLGEVSRETGLSVVVVRPPLVYGPNAPGNFGVLVRWATSGVPLPFGGIRNRRSIVGIDNLCDFLVLTCWHPAAINETFLVADSLDISTSDLLASLRKGIGMRPRLLQIPSVAMSAFLHKVGKARLAFQLYGNLQVSTQKALRSLAWHPPHDTASGLAKAALNTLGGMSFNHTRIPEHSHEH